MKVCFDGGNKLEFHGAKVSSNGGLLAYRDLDDALGLCDSISDTLSNRRTGRNIQHYMPALLCQSIYSRLEDIRTSMNRLIMNRWIRVSNWRISTQLS